MEWSDKQIETADKVRKGLGAALYDISLKAYIEPPKGITTLHNTLFAALNGAAPDEARNGARAVLAQKGDDMIHAAAMEFHEIKRGAPPHEKRQYGHINLNSLTHIGVTGSRDLATEAVEKQTAALEKHTEALQQQKPVLGKHTQQATRKSDDEISLAP